MIGDTAQLAVELKLKDQQFQSNLAKDEASLKRLNSTVGKTGGAFNAVARNIGSFEKNMGNAFRNVGKGVGTAVHNIEKLAFAAGALAVGGGIAAVKWAGDFEAQLRTINTIARETPEGLSRIGDGIREIARTTGTPLEELTQGYYDLLSAGIKAADAQNVLTNANKLAIGGLASAAETVDLLTTAINVYGGDASQAGRFTDEFAKAIERGKVTAAELAASYAQVAPLARSLNIENKELAAGYATLTAAGTPAAEASTQMASAMTALLKTTPGLEKLQKQTKNNYAAIAGSQGLNVALEQMRVDADKAGIQLVDLVGRKEALLYILQTTGPNLRKYNADLAAMGDAAGTAAGQMAERQQGLNYQLSILKAGIKDAGITIGTALIPKLVPLIQKLNEFLSGHQDDIKRFGTDLANAFENVAKWIGKLDFRQIGDSLKTAAFFGKGLIQVFLSAPQWLQTAVVTGWGLNKLTGGAVQNIMADLTKAAIGGVLQQFVARGSSVANPMYVMDVSGGLGGLGAIGGKSSPLSLLLSASIAASIVAAAVPIGEAFANALPDWLKGGSEHPGESESQRRNREAREAMERNRPRPRSTDPRIGFLVNPVADAQIGFLVADFKRWMPKSIDGLGSKLTAMQQQLHTDLLNAIGVIKSSSDPAAIAAAVDAALASVKGGAGSAGTTQGLLTSLKTQLAAAQASGNTDLATKIKDAIKQIEPFQKGRQWQAEQLAKAQKIVDSNKSTADKVAALKGIQQDLLSHQRTMAGEIVAGLLDVVSAVKNIKIPHAPGTGPLERDPGPTGPKPGYSPRPPGKGPTVNDQTGFVINASISTRDVNTAQDWRRRAGPTPTQAGVA